MLNDEFAFQLSAVGIAYFREYKAIPDRKFAFDFYIPKRKLLIELQGGVYQYNPSHTSAGNIRRDCEKGNLAVLNGYAVLHFTTDMVESGEALQLVERILEEK